MITTQPRDDIGVLGNNLFFSNSVGGEAVPPAVELYKKTLGKDRYFSLPVARVCRLTWLQDRARVNPRGVELPDSAKAFHPSRYLKRPLFFRKNERRVYNL